MIIRLEEILKGRTIPKIIEPPGAKKTLEKFGVKFIKKCSIDRDYWIVKFPRGWQILGPDGRTIEVWDNKDRLRASMVFKYNIYEPKIGMTLATRFSIIQDTKAFNNSEACYHVVLDGAYIIYTTTRIKTDIEHLNSALVQAWEEAVKWLSNQGFYAWENPGAYWNRKIIPEQFL